MEMKQIATLMNNVTNELLGKSDLFQEDLSNVVDAGEELFSATSYDHYVKTLVNHIGRMIFVSRVYKGSAPKVLMDSWEFGSVLEKVQMDMPTATENESWELEDNAVYEQDTFYKPKVSAKFFNKRVTFEVPVSIAEKQVKQSFSSATQLNSFVSMIFVGVDKSMTVKLEALIMRTINNMIGETVYNEYEGNSQSASSGVRAINLLYLYNTDNSTSLTAAQAIRSKEFLRYAVNKISLYKSRLRRISTLFNIGGKERHTDTEDLHVVMLADFVAGTKAYLQSDTFHKDLVELPNFEEVAYWQASGLSYAFTDTSKVNIKTASEHEINVSGVLGVMFDRYALGVSCLERRTTTHYNAKAEFYTNWYKMEAGYFNDFNENFIVFFIA